MSAAARDRARLPRALARRAIADRLPPELAAAAAEFITGLSSPARGEPARPSAEELAGIYSARLGRNRRVL